MQSKAYVLNTGVITAIGNNTAENWTALKEGKDGIAMPAYLDTHWKDEFPLAEVKYKNEELAAGTGLPPNWPRTALLSAIAFNECWKGYEELKTHFPPAFFSANTVGGMDLTEKVFGNLQQAAQSVHQDNYRYHECGAITQLVAEHFRWKGFQTTISTACSSSANSIMMAAQMIESGIIDLAIAGGADSLSRFTLNGFNTLMIVDKQKCQPFDQNRRGLNLGEGAGYLLLGSEKVIKHLRITPQFMISGYANANDAFHQTASSPEGLGNQAAMRQALSTAGLQPSDINYINAHGTGTPNNDSAESIAIEKVFGDNVPLFSSTKCYTGHTLGASGGIEAVYSLLSLKHDYAFANLRLETLMEDVTIHPNIQPKELPIQHVMSNSFGFGGNCSTLIFSKC